jgi:hypothetical protein
VVEPPFDMIKSLVYYQKVVGFAIYLLLNSFAKKTLKYFRESLEMKRILMVIVLITINWHHALTIVYSQHERRWEYHTIYSSTVCFFMSTDIFFVILYIVY